MAIYIQIDGIKGDVTSKGHEGWIEVHSCDFEVKRELEIQTGKVVNRESTTPTFAEVILTKHADQSSPKLFDKACRGKAIDTVKIDLCRTSEEMKAYSQYTLNDVIISKYADSMHHEGKPIETIHLNYTKIEKVYTPGDAQHQSGSPIRSSYDIKTATAA